MSFTRYFPHAGQAFGLLALNPAALARVAGPCLGLGLAAVLLKDADVPGALGMSSGLTALAFGGLGFFWQRTVAGAEAADLGLAQMIGRLLLWTLAYQLLQGFELFPAVLFGLLLDGHAQAELLTRTGLQVFQILVGTFFLLLPHLALARWKDLAGTRLQEMVLAGGLAVGLGYVLVTIPFLVLGELAKGGIGGVLSPGTAQTVVELVIQFFGALVTAGYFALVWTSLRATAPSLIAAAQAAGDAAAPEPAKPRRTSRITKATKAKR